VDAGITTIKHAIKAGVAIADAVELGISKIKEQWGKEWEHEAVFRKKMEALKPQRCAGRVTERRYQRCSRQKA
jgi:hypothetical protein